MEDQASEKVGLIRALCALQNIEQMIIDGEEPTAALRECQRAMEYYDKILERL